MTDFRLFVKLLLIMVGVSIGAGAINTGFLFVDALNARKEVLIQAAARYRRALIATNRYHELHGTEHHLKEFDADQNYVMKATASQIRGASEVAGSRGDIELIIGMLRDKDTGYILFFSIDMPTDIKMGSSRATPMQLALQGKTGTIRERDYEGSYVLAAYTYIESVGLGIVAKSHIKDIVLRFMKGAIFTTTPALVLVLVGMFFFWRTANHLIGKLREDNERYKRTVREVDQGNKDLAESEQRLQCFFDAAFEGIVITEAGEFIDCNKHFAKMFGYTVDEITGMPVADLVYPDDLPLVRKNIAEEYSKPYEHRSVHKDGTIVHCEVHGQMSFLKGRTVRITAIHDLTERVKNAEAIRELHERKRHATKMEAIGNFAAGIAHDFNNTLTPIIGNCDLLMLKLANDDLGRDNVLKILGSAETATLLVKRIQTFVRKDDNIESIVPLKVDACVNEAFEFLRSIVPASIEMEMFLEEELGLVTITDVMIRQILMNLVKNSVHAMEDNEGRIYIDVSNEKIMVSRFGLEPGQYLKLEVEDNGCGMPEEVLERALDPYYTTKDEEGTGLGLAVVHGILDNHGGIVHLQSSEGSGTKATIYLPIMEAGSESGDYCEIESPIVMGNGQRILFVDDERNIVDMAGHILTSLNYQATCFTDSVKALEKFRQNPKSYDVLMTDMTMPEISGITLLQEIKNINPEIKVVLSSGLGIAGRSRADLYSDLINFYLQKPVTRREYARVLSEIFSGTNEL